MLRPEVYTNNQVPNPMNNAAVEWSLNYIGAGVGYLYKFLKRIFFIVTWIGLNELYDEWGTNDWNQI